MKVLIALTTITFLVSVQASSVPIFPKDERVSERSVGTRTRERLMKTLLENYVKSVKPEPSDGSPLQVTISLSLFNLDNVDTIRRIIETHSLVLLSWTDERLSWDPSDFRQVGMLHMPSDSIWIPDITLYNNDGNDQKPMIDMIADVYSNGSVIYVPELHLKSLCGAGQQHTNGINTFDRLRFRDLVCKFKFGSWTYDAKEMKLVIPSSQIDMSDFRRLPTNEFQVKNTSAEVNQITYKCCPNPYFLATFTIVVGKNLKYYYDSAPISTGDDVETRANAQVYHRDHVYVSGYDVPEVR